MVSCRHKSEIVLNVMYLSPLCALFCISREQHFPDSFTAAFLNKFDQKEGTDQKSGQEEETSLPPLSLFSFLYIYIYISLAEFVLHLICDSVPPEALPPWFNSHQGYWQMRSSSSNSASLLPPFDFRVSEEKLLPAHANL